MSEFARKWQDRRAMAKGRRAMNKAIVGANAETVRLELLAIASRNDRAPLL